MNIRLKNTTNIALTCILLAFFWIFSRFTIDDAFITWRFGRNLVDHGFWNYNPSSFDPTQSYTNPVFALLSIIPNFLSVDVVLFFKLVSILFLLLFVYWFHKKARGATQLIMLFFCIPASFIHVFSGLETFLFISLLSALLICLFERNEKASLLIAIFLFFTRPEAWLLLFILPVYFSVFINTAGSRKEGNFIRRFNIASTAFSINIKKLLSAFVVLGIPLLIYFAFHKAFFSSMLPVSFYIKSKASIDFMTLLGFSFFLTPLLFLPLIKEYKLFVTSMLLFGAMILSYASSNLLMNYSARFQFHIFAPVYFFTVYLVTKNRHKTISFYTNDSINQKMTLPITSLFKYLLLVISLPFLLISIKGLGGTITYYPRLLTSHGELGRVIKKNAKDFNIKCFAFGDAGLVAYNADIISLDIIGLGNSLIAREGITDNTLNQYSPDLICFYADSSGIQLNDFSQKKIMDWAVKRGYKQISNVYWYENYVLTVYGKNNIPDLNRLSETSKAKNTISKLNYLKKTIIKAPWQYWHK